MHEVHQLLVGLHHFHSTQIDATQHDPRLFRRTHEGLQGRLSVEFDGEVNDIATFHQTVGRCISPAPSDIDTHGRASPDNLVVSHTEGRFFCQVARPNKRTVPQ